ncbi:340_t:CDS:2 [Funneliformis geosporum]|uniref:340_t:CDS:1 n=1 Tax=Funneliformis geosporum TaxID=1117311 RepID=A0A9W4WIT9_9GLOM|nr:340_t:CDS:2 [Funneliformis geosporum]
MVLKKNLEKSLNDLEMRIKELEQSNEALRSQFKNLEEKVREETKANQVIINNYEEKFREREETGHNSKSLRLHDHILQGPLTTNPI